MLTCALFDSDLTLVIYEPRTLKTSQRNGATVNTSILDLYRKVFLIENGCAL